MQFKIHHPRILLVLLMVIGAVTASAVLLADRGGSEPVRSVEIPAAPLKPPTEKQKQDAIDIAKASGIVEQINGGQDWTVEHIYWVELAGTEAIGFEIKWQEPVDSQGPWTLFHCTGTRKVVTPVDWSGITRLTVYVDMNSQSVAGHAVMSDENDKHQPVMGSGHLDSVAKVYDIESGEILYDGLFKDFTSSLRQMCPPGTYDGD